MMPILLLEIKIIPIFAPSKTNVIWQLRSDYKDMARKTLLSFM